MSSLQESVGAAHVIKCSLYFSSLIVSCRSSLFCCHPVASNSLPKRGTQLPSHHSACIHVRIATGIRSPILHVWCFWGMISQDISVHFSPLLGLLLTASSKMPTLGYVTSCLEWRQSDCLILTAVTMHPWLVPLPRCLTVSLQNCGHPLSLGHCHCRFQPFAPHLPHIYTQQKGTSGC